MADLSEKDQELEDLKIMYENVVEHSTALEDSLSQTNKTMKSLLQSMKKYLSPQLYEAISGGKSEVSTRNHARKKLTIFFSDIVGFTKTTDILEAEVMSELLNEYLNQMAGIALKYGGTIDKFIGDAVMIFFGDPEFISDQEHAKRCVSMACEMQEKIAELSEVWSQKGAPHGLKVRMGINTGYCTVGNFGSDNRLDYTIIGGQVNIASRLESVAKSGTIAVSETTWALVKDFFKGSFVGEIEVKGVHHPIPVYRVHLANETDEFKSFATIGHNSVRISDYEITQDSSHAEKDHALHLLKQVFDKIKSWVQ